MTVQTVNAAVKPQAKRSQLIQVRVTEAEHALVVAMMQKDMQPSESSFLRTLILLEARRRQLLKEGAK